ncbi:MAG: glycosyltransferase [Lachnospiraceae bacterium]|nr:glycosyltransferase [Lachnospiraceae bacterium]
MIKYYLINSNFRGSRYGVGTYIRQMSEGLRSTGKYDISYINLFSNEKEYTITHDRFGCVTYSIPSVDCDHEQYCRKVIYLLTRYIHNEEHIVFHFNFIHHDCMVNMLREYYTNCRIVLTVHYLQWCFELKGNYTRFKSIVRSYGQRNQKENGVYSSYLAEQNFFCSCDEIIVLSEYTKSILAMDYDISTEKMHLVYNGLNGKAEEYEKTTSNIILYVGRVDKIKGVEYLIHAFKRIVTKYTDYSLYIVGEGDYNKYMPLCASIRDKVIFTGKLNYSELNELYCKATIGVLPSFHEQCSYSAIEMLRHGLPLVITSSTGLKETLREMPENIVSIPKGRFNREKFVSSLANKMDYLLSDKVLRQKQSRQMCEIFKRRYTRSCMIKHFDSVIEKSFKRKDYVVPTDIYTLFDKKMFHYINQRPDFDLEYNGLAGIGVYLWYRICLLRKKKDIDSQVTLGELHEHMIYYLDWLWYYVQNEYNDDMIVCEELQYTLHDMNKCGFFKIRIKQLIKAFGIEDNVPCLYDGNDVMRNTIKICNCKI